MTNEDIKLAAKAALWTLVLVAAGLVAMPWISGFYEEYMRSVDAHFVERREKHDEDSFRRAMKRLRERE